MGQRLKEGKWKFEPKKNFCREWRPFFFLLPIQKKISGPKKMIDEQQIMIKNLPFDILGEEILCVDPTKHRLLVNTEIIIFTH